MSDSLLYGYDNYYDEKERSFTVFGKTNENDNVVCWRWINFPEAIMYFQLNNERHKELSITREDLIDFYPALEEQDFTFELEVKTKFIAPVVSFTVSTNVCQILDDDTPSFVTMMDNEQQHTLLRSHPVEIQTVKVIVWSSSKSTSQIIDHHQTLYQTPINRHSFIFSLAWLQTMKMNEYFTVHHHIKSFEWICVPQRLLKKVHHFMCSSLTDNEYLISYRDAYQHIKTVKLETVPNINIVCIDYQPLYSSFSLIPCIWNVQNDKMCVHPQFPSHFYMDTSKVQNNTKQIVTSTSTSSSSGSFSTTNTVSEKQLFPPFSFLKQLDFEQACQDAIDKYLGLKNESFPVNMIVGYRSHDTINYITKCGGRTTYMKPQEQQQTQPEEDVVVEKEKEKKRVSKITNTVFQKPKPFGILWCWTSDLYKKDALMTQGARQSHSLERLYNTYLDYTIHPRNFAFINWSILQKFNILSFLSECCHLTSCPFHLVLKFQPSVMNMWYLLQAYYDENYIIRQIVPSVITDIATIPGVGEEKNNNNNENEDVGDMKKKGGSQVLGESGVYEYVTSIDWTSSYPNIISKSNLDYSTIRTRALVQYNEEFVSTNVFQNRDATSIIVQGVLPKLFENGIRLRREYKMNVESNPTFHARSNAVKQMTNFIYGCLWQSNFRFYHPMFCQYVTGMQRQVLKESIDLINQNEHFCVIGGHTDSLIIAPKRKNNATIVSFHNLINERFPQLSCGIENEFVMMTFIHNNLYAGITNDVSGVWKGCHEQQFGIAKFAAQFRQKLLLDIMTLFHDQNGLITFKNSKDGPDSVFEQRLFIHLEEMMMLFSSGSSGEHNETLHVDDMMICERLSSTSAFNLNNLDVSAPNLTISNVRLDESSDLMRINGFVAALYLKLFHPHFHHHHFEEDDVIEFVMIKDYTNCYFSGRSPVPVLLAKEFKLDIDWYLFTHLLTILKPILCSSLKIFSDGHELSELLQSFAHKILILSKK